MMTSATQRILEGMIDKIRREYAPLKIILFGSYAYGTPHPDSDIDLLIVKETANRFIDRCAEVRYILSDPRRKIPLEILVLTPREISERLAVGDQFVREIVERGRTLYAA